MCIIADPPTFIPMFKPSDPEHLVFSPVKEWIVQGKGNKFIIGGTKYLNELNSVGSILKIFTELEKRNKVLRCSLKEVDTEEARVKAIAPSKDFDDPHLVALVRLTGCKLVCIRDARSHKFLRSTRLYQSTRDRPRLYTRLKNKSLLCTQNIGACCK